MAEKMFTLVLLSDDFSKDMTVNGIEHGLGLVWFQVFVYFDTTLA